MQFIDLKAQYNCSKKKINERINTVLEHGKYIMGPEVQELEEKLCDYVGSKYAVTCANGTDSIQLALMALEIGGGDAVIVPSFTFFATAEAVSIVNAEPVFADINPVTFNLAPDSVEKAIQNYIDAGKGNLKAIIAVDLFGLPADYDELQKIATKYGLALIEDGAQGFGGTISGRKVCSFGDISTTSFFPAKPLGCYGDGGSVFTNDVKLAEKLRSLRVHGKGIDKYDNVRIGLNSRLDTIQAAILLEKLEIFDDELERRQDIAERYIKALSYKIDVPQIMPNFSSSWAQFTLKASDEFERKKIMTLMAEKGIPSTIYYPKPIHESGAYSHNPIKYCDLSISENMSKRVFSIPMHPYLSLDDQNLVIQAILDSMG